MNKKNYLTIHLAFICFFSFPVLAQNNLPEKPNPVTFYNNLSTEFPNFLSSSEANSIELKLKAFSDSTSNQIVVLIIDDLMNYEPWEFATEVGEKWGIGGEKEDNGVLILIKPTGGEGQRKTFIASGRGLEAVIPDFTCLEIVNNQLVPNFKSRNFYLGIDAATDVLMSLAVKEFNFEQYSENYSANSNNDPVNEWQFWAFFVSIIIIFMVFSAIKGGGKGGGGMYYSSGGFSSSSSSFSGGSSFGGGSFGGGGAGGSW